MRDGLEEIFEQSEQYEWNLKQAEQLKREQLRKSINAFLDEQSYDPMLREMDARDLENYLTGDPDYYSDYLDYFSQRIEALAQRYKVWEKIQKRKGIADSLSTEY